MSNRSAIAAALAELSPEEAARRRARWHSFQVIFAFAYVGVVLDIITTAMGFAKTGKAYEQNPVGGLLIHGIGWIGLFLVLTGFCVLCYVSFRVVCFRASRLWSGLLTGLLAIVTVFRWVAVITAIIYLLQPGR